MMLCDVHAHFTLALSLQ